MRLVEWQSGNKGLTFRASCNVDAGELMAILADAIYFGREPSTKREAEAEIRDYFKMAAIKDMPLENIWERFPEQVEEFGDRALEMMRKWWPTLATELEDDK